MAGCIDAKVKLFLRSYAVKHNEEILWGSIGIKANKSVSFLQKSTYVMFDVLPIVDSTGIDMMVNPEKHDGEDVMQWYDGCRKSVVFDMCSVMVKPYDAENYFTEFKFDDDNENRTLYAALRTIQEQWNNMVFEDIVLSGLQSKYTVPAVIQNKGSTHPHMHEYFDRKCFENNGDNNLMIYRIDLEGRGMVDVDADRFRLKLPHKISQKVARFRQGCCMRGADAVLY